MPSEPSPDLEIAVTLRQIILRQADAARAGTSSLSRARTHLSFDSLTTDSRQRFLHSD